MKILYLHQYFATRTDSTGTRSYEMARRWVAKGHEVHVITTARTGKRFRGWRVENVEGILVHAIWVPYSNKMGFWQRILAFLKYGFRAGRRAVSTGGDCLFVTSTPLSVLIPGHYARARLQVPFVFEVRDLWPTLPIAIGALKNPVLKRLAFALEASGYKRADRIIALSRDMVPHIEESGGSEAKIVVAPNSCDTDLFDASPEIAGQFRDRHPFLQRRYLVTYAGTLGRINGVAYLAEIAGQVRARNGDVDFLVIGEGQERALVEQRATALGVLEKNFWLLGPVPKTEIVAALASTTVAVSLFVDLKEMWANSANKFFDALASGTPVMINYGGWQKELLERTGAGIVVPAANAKLAADKLIDFLEKKSEIDRAGMAARRLAHTEFDRDKISDRVLGAIASAAER